MTLDELIQFFKDGGAAHLAMEEREQFIAETQQREAARAQEAKAAKAGKK